MDAPRRWMRRFGHTRAFAWLGPRLAHRIDRLVHRLTAGRRVAASAFLPTLMLTTTGRRSGEERTTPVAYVEHPAGLAVAGTNFGRDDHPAWTYNLLEQPNAWVEVAGERWEVLARPVEDAAERAELWGRFDAVWPAYATYRRRTDRRVRLFVLEPVSSPG